MQLLIEYYLPLMLLSSGHSSRCISNTHDSLEYTAVRKQLKPGQNHSPDLSLQAAW